MRQPSALLLALSLCLSALGVLVAPAHAQDVQPTYGWTNDAPIPADIDEWVPEPRDAPYFENWDLWLWADDGTFVALQFLTSSFGFGFEGQGSARLLIVDADAFNVHGEQTEGVGWGDRGFDNDGDWDWTIEEDHVRVDWRDCYFVTHEDRIEVFMRGRRRQNWVEFTLTPESPFLRPGDGEIEYGWDRHVFYTLQAMPRVRFEGRINQKPDRDAPDEWRPVTGVGYVEHSRTNAFPHDIAESFLGFRALRPDGLSIVVDNVTAPAAYGNTVIPWALVLLDGEVIFESFDVSVVATDTRTENWGDTDYRVPFGYVIEARRGDDLVQVNVSNSELVSADSFLNRVSSLLRRVISAVMDPYDFDLSNDYEARITIDGNAAGVSGRGWTTFNATQ